MLGETRLLTDAMGVALSEAASTLDARPAVTSPQKPASGLGPDRLKSSGED